VEEIGVVRDKTPAGPAIRFRIVAPKSAFNLKLGDSVACNGVCLTAEEVFSDGFSASAVPETLSRTTLGEIQKGNIINLETALKAGSPMGGHIVQGHVDGVGEVSEIRDLPAGAGRELQIRVPVEFEKYCVAKGSITLQGVSLTIAAVKDQYIQIALVPHTLQHTTLANAIVGTRLNIEVDLVGKYVEKLLGYVGVAAGITASGPNKSGLDAASLEKWGYGV
jgi:riboflavin synthase